MMGAKMVEFMKLCRELLDHAYYSELATNYHKGYFNYGHYTNLLHEIILEKGSEDEIKLIYPGGIPKTRVE